MQKNIKKILLTTSLSLLLVNNLFANGAVSANAGSAAGAGHSGAAGVGAASNSGNGSSSQSSSASQSGASASSYGSAGYFSSGFYGGMQVGSSMADNKYNGTLSDDVNQALIVPFGLSDRKNKFVADVFAGARYVYSNNFVGGCEFGYESNYAKMQELFTVPGVADFDFRVKYGGRFTSSLVFGQIFNERMFAYGKLGIAVSKFSFTEINTCGCVAFTTKNTTETKVAFAPAVGFEYALNRSWSTRFELGAELYGETSRSSAVPGEATLRAKANSNVYNCKIGLAYKI